MPSDHKSNRKYTDRHASKTADIKRALVHRARIRKNYFKLLKQEGEEDEQEQEHQQKRKPLPPQNKPINFAERAKLAKERKEEARKAKLAEIKQKREKLELNKKQREIKKNRMAKHTSTGQPLMGPRINNLLDKIRNDMEK
ncbi:rRNA-processing protein FYV7 [Spathaspora sp. JA1]|nr:rRNA-processing protein FYV7 [Spathaspora sp. JA1]